MCIPARSWIPCRHASLSCQNHRGTVSYPYDVQQTANIIEVGNSPTTLVVDLINVGDSTVGTGGPYWTYKYFITVDNSSYNAYITANVQTSGTGGTLTFPTNNTGNSVIKLKFLNVTITPTLPANPPISGTAYQNTNPYDVSLKIPVTYSPTSSAAATLATGTSSSSTVTTSTKVSYPAGITTGIINTYEMVVLAGQYFELVVTNATIGTVEVQVA